MLMLSNANLLVLDEPTNHLDVESIEALEDAIERYEGTVILVSHDRELLRSLTSRVWVLHERHVTNYDGSFGEWEEASAQRARAAAVRAAEDAALQRVHERQKVAATGRRDDSVRSGRRREEQAARRAFETAEQEVMALEQRVALLTAALEDPELYTRTEGVAEARRLGVELESARRALDAALERWSVASDQVEAFSGRKPT
jgi:ATP-binding cassette subfamily F protein 3